MITSTLLSMQLMITYVLSLVGSPTSEDCQKITLANPHTREVNTVCISHWDRVKSLKYNIKCVPTNHGHEHMIYVSKVRPDEILIPFIDKKFLVCVGT